MPPAVREPSRYRGAAIGQAGQLILHLDTSVVGLGDDARTAASRIWSRPGRPSAGVPAVPIRSVTDQYPPDVRILPAAVGTCSSQRELHGIERRPPRGDKLAQHARRRPQIARLQG